MSFQLASAYVSLSNRGFSGVMGGIASIGQRLTSLAPIALGASAAIGTIGGAGSLAGLVSLAANLERTETQFGTLLGSAEKAKQMVADLSAFSASTPFQMDGLTQTAKTLLAFGVTQEQVIPTMKALGDVAAASGADLNDLGNIYGKVRARGVLMTESLDQFNERAIPVGAELAKMFGKTESEIRDMASSGQISFADLQQAMVNMTSQGGMAFGGMAAQSQTLGGLWSTLSDNISLALTEIGVAIVDGFDLKTVTANIIGFVGRFRDEWLPNIVAGFQWMSQNIINPVSSALGMMGGMFFDFVSNLDIYWQIAQLQVANYSLNAVAHITTLGRNIVSTITWAIGNWRNLLVDIANAHITVFQNVGTNLRAIWQGVLDFIAGRGFNVDFTPLLQGFESTISQMPELAKANLDSLKPSIDGLYSELEQRRADAQQRQQTDAAQVATMTIDPANAPRTANATGGGNDRASFVGIAQLAEQMQAQAGAAQDRQKQIEAAQTSAQAMQQLLARASGEGLRVSMAAADPAPMVQFEFGAT